MPKTDAYEAQLFVAHDKGALQSIARKSELSKFKAAASAAAAQSGPKTSLLPQNSLPPRASKTDA